MSGAGHYLAGSGGEEGEGVVVKVVLLGGFTRRNGSLELRDSPPLQQVFQALAHEYPEALDSSGDPRPGILVFVNGVDYRLLDKSERVAGSLEVKIVRVYHGG